MTRRRVQPVEALLVEELSDTSSGANGPGEPARQVTHASIPPGRRTRPNSRSAAGWSGRNWNTKAETTPSIDASSNGSLSADAWIYVRRADSSGARPLAAVDAVDSMDPGTSIPTTATRGQRRTASIANVPASTIRPASPARSTVAVTWSNRSSPGARNTGPMRRGIPEHDRPSRFRPPRPQVRSSPPSAQDDHTPTVATLRRARPQVDRRWLL